MKLAPTHTPKHTARLANENTIPNNDKQGEKKKKVEEEILLLRSSGRRYIDEKNKR